MPRKKNLSFFKLQSTLHFETQLVQPDIQLQLVDQNAPGTPVAATLPDNIRGIPRTYYLLERLGPRYQSEKSWIEVGGETGEQFQKPALYTFLPPAGVQGGPVTCNLSATTFVQSCVTHPNAAGQFVARSWT